MRATSLVLIGFSQIHFVINMCAYLIYTQLFFYVLITVTVILCTNGSINNFVCLSVCQLGAGAITLSLLETSHIHLKTLYITANTYTLVRTFDLYAYLHCIGVTFI